MQRDVATPDAYVAAVPAAQRPLVDRLRTLIRAAAPHAREEIRWGMLNYDDRGAIFALAAQKHHVALYVMAPDVLARSAAAFDGVDRGKGCLRFRRLEEIPVAAVRTLLDAALASPVRACR